MSFYINMEQTGDVAVLQCAGRMVRAQPLCVLKDAVTGLSQLRVVVLDLSEVEILDAGGLGILVSLHNWACVNGTQLSIANPSRPVRQMLELSKLMSVLHISSVEDVIQIFCSGEGPEKPVQNFSPLTAPINTRITATTSTRRSPPHVRSTTNSCRSSHSRKFWAHPESPADASDCKTRAGSCRKSPGAIYSEYGREE